MLIEANSKRDTSRKCTSFEVVRPEFKFWPCHFLAMCHLLACLNH